MASVISKKYYELLAALHTLEEEACAKRVNLLKNAEYVSQKKLFEYADKRADYDHATQYISEVIGIGRKLILAGSETLNQIMEIQKQIKDERDKVESACCEIERDENRSFYDIAYRKVYVIERAQQKVEKVTGFNEKQKFSPEQWTLIEGALCEFGKAINKFEENEKLFCAENSKCCKNELYKGTVKLVLIWLTCLVTGIVLPPYLSYLFSWLIYCLYMGVQVVAYQLAWSGIEWERRVYVTCFVLLLLFVLAIVLIAFKVVEWNIEPQSFLIAAGLLNLSFSLGVYSWYKTHKLRGWMVSSERIYDIIIQDLKKNIRNRN